MTRKLGLISVGPIKHTTSFYCFWAIVAKNRRRPKGFADRQHNTEYKFTGSTCCRQSLQLMLAGYLYQGHSAQAETAHKTNRQTQQTTVYRARGSTLKEVIDEPQLGTRGISCNTAAQTTMVYMSYNRKKQCLKSAKSHKVKVAIHKVETC